MARGVSNGDDCKKRAVLGVGVLPEAQRVINHDVE
jgi:hypothetical protein